MINKPATRIKIDTLIVLFFLFALTSVSAQGSTHLLQPSKQDTVKQPVIVAGQIPGQSQHLDPLNEYVRLNQEPPGEKVYLHLDRPNYMVGDTIWFKAYSWYGYDQIPDTTSRILYADLLNPKSRVVLTKKLLIQNGTSWGDFILDTTIVPGKYTLRAYTRWMQNLNTGEPFYQTVTISPASQNFQVECLPVIIKQPGNDSLKISFRYFEIDPAGDLRNYYNHKVSYSLKIGNQPLDSGQVLAENTNEQIIKFSLAGIKNFDSVGVFGISINDKRLNYKKEFQIPLKDGIDLQFFPEGGKLVTGLNSRVAFKAIGTDGLSREVDGTIETGEGEVVTNFKSSHKGMGVFTLKPEAKKEYFARLLYNNKKYLIPLPSASEAGCTMSVGFTETGKDSYLTIKQSPSEVATRKYVIGSAYGKIWFSAFVNLINDSCQFQIPLDLLPEGVCRLTVLNHDFKPESERLIYVDKNQRFKIEVIPDSSSYTARSKVTLLIKTLAPGGIPVQTDLSLAVVDKEQITKDAQAGGITDYKLLGSELHGYIEDAGSYFKDDSCTNHGALDLLLLTQGYRKFLPGNSDPDKQRFQPEKGFDISGEIKFNGSKSREKKFNYQEVGLTLMCRSDNVYFDQSRPDSLGRFRFHIPLLSGKSHSLLQATNSKGKPLNGEISLNDTVAPPKFSNPLLQSYNMAVPTIENVHKAQAVKKTEISKNPYYGPMSVTLGEVTVTAKSKNWYRDFEHNATKVANLDSLDPSGQRYESIFDLLVREFGAKEYLIPSENIKTIFLPCISIALSDFFPIYVINGNTYFNASEDFELIVNRLRTLSSLHVNEIKKIMVIHPGKIAEYYASYLAIKDGLWQSLVVIETYSDFSYRGDPKGIKTFILDGLDTPRAFYSPRYEGPSKESPVYDGRATIFWEPSVRTDTTGQAKIEFFTGDRKTNLEVICNGIEVESGNPGQEQALINSNRKKSGK
jgi:hypothetical protein